MQTNMQVKKAKSSKNPLLRQASRQASGTSRDRERHSPETPQGSFISRQRRAHHRDCSKAALAARAFIGGVADFLRPMAYGESTNPSVELTRIPSSTSWWGHTRSTTIAASRCSTRCPACGAPSTTLHATRWRQARHNRRGRCREVSIDCDNEPLRRARCAKQQLLRLQRRGALRPPHEYRGTLGRPQFGHGAAKYRAYQELQPE